MAAQLLLVPFLRVPADGLGDELKGHPGGRGHVRIMVQRVGAAAGAFGLAGGTVKQGGEQLPPLLVGSPTTIQFRAMADP